MSTTPMLSRLITKVILPIVIIAGAASGFIYLKNSQPEVPAEPISEQVWGVSSHTVKLQDLAPQITLYGVVEAGETAQLSATVSAFVNRVNVGRGDKVVKGQHLVQLDDRELRLTLTQREASLADIEARINSEINSNKTNQKALKIEQQLQAINQKNLQRQTQLVAQNVAPASRLEDAIKAVQQQQLALLNRQNTIADHPNRIAQLKAQATQSKVQLEFARIDLQRTQITAPFNGRVLSVDTAAGNRVRNGDRVIKLYNIQSLEVRSQIPERYLPMIQAAKSGQDLQATVSLYGQKFSLTLDRLSAEASASQGGIDVYFSLEKNQHIEVGRNLQVQMQLPTEANVAAVPALAVYGQSRVYRIVDQRLQAVSIHRVGEWTSPTGEHLTLVRGANLRTGDQLLTTQLPNAVTGLLVETR
jgi:multidrug efflux pump subunit AcrA (membrane-fusion protein)